MLLLLMALAGGAEMLPPADSYLGDAAQRQALRLLAEIASSEPTIEEVQQAAAQGASSSGDADSWVGRARLAAWLPRISAEYRHDDRSSRVVGLQSGSEVDYLKILPGDTIGVRASWNFDEVVFSASELQAATAAAQVARRREERVERATQLYFDRRKKQAELLLAPPGPVRERIARQLELDSLTAALDALTSGIFQRRSAR